MKVSKAWMVSLGAVMLVALVALAGWSFTSHDALSRQAELSTAGIDAVRACGVASDRLIVLPSDPATARALAASAQTACQTAAPAASGTACDEFVSMRLAMGGAIGIGIDKPSPDNIAKATNATDAAKAEDCPAYGG